MLELLSAAAQADLLALIDSRVTEKLAERTGDDRAQSPWLTVVEAAEYLRTSASAVRKRIERGQLRAYRPEGSQILLKREDLANAGPPMREVL